MFIYQIYCHKFHDCYSSFKGDLCLVTLAVAHVHFDTYMYIQIIYVIYICVFIYIFVYHNIILK